MKIETQLPADWQKFLKTEIDQNYFTSIIDMVEKEYRVNICYPPVDQIFNAFHAVDIDNLKVVIIGQDPYHGDGEANGLAFSVCDDIAIPPSLRNIFKEIAMDFDAVFMPQSGNLKRWSSQGVLLLNATLTVQRNIANSHKNIGWQQFTDAIIKNISSQKSNIVFMLWGNFAIQKSKLIDGSKHLILTSGHPSPMSANQGKWFGNKHFSKANDYLIQHHQAKINW